MLDALGEEQQQSMIAIGNRARSRESLSGRFFMYDGVEYVLGSIIVIPRDVNPERSRFYFLFDKLVRSPRGPLQWLTLYIDDFALSFTSKNRDTSGFLWRDLEFSTDKFRDTPKTL